MADDLFDLGGPTGGTNPEYWDQFNSSGQQPDPTKLHLDAGALGYGEGPLYSLDPWDTVGLRLRVPPVKIRGKLIQAQQSGPFTQLPGLCRVKALPLVAFDKKKPGGANGLTITAQGYVPGPVDIEVMLWTWAQWVVYVNIQNTFWKAPTRAGTIAPIDIQHPGLNPLGVNSIVIQGISVPEDGPAPQSKIIHIKAVEWLPPGPKTVTKTVKAPKVLSQPGMRMSDVPKNGPHDPPSVGETGPATPPGGKKDTSPGAG